MVSDPELWLRPGVVTPIPAAEVRAGDELPGGLFVVAKLHLHNGLLLIGANTPEGDDLRQAAVRPDDLIEVKVRRRDSRKGKRHG